MSIKHYRIRPLDQGGYFIARRTTFASLVELVKHYSRDADGLCVTLGKPPSRVETPQTSTFTFDDQWEVDRSAIKVKIRMQNIKLSNFLAHSRNWIRPIWRGI